MDLRSSPVIGNWLAATASTMTHTMAYYSTTTTCAKGGGAVVTSTDSTNRKCGGLDENEFSQQEASSGGTTIPGDLAVFTKRIERRTTCCTNSADVKDTTTSGARTGPDVFCTNFNDTSINNTTTMAAAAVTTIDMSSTNSPSNSTTTTSSNEKGSSRQKFFSSCSLHSPHSSSVSSPSPCGVTTNPTSSLSSGYITPSTKRREQHMEDGEDLYRLAGECRTKLKGLLHALFCYRDLSSESISPSDLYKMEKEYDYHIDCVDNCKNLSDLQNYLILLGPCIQLRLSPVECKLTIAQYLRWQLDIIRSSEDVHCILNEKSQENVHVYKKNKTFVKEGWRPGVDGEEMGGSRKKRRRMEEVGTTSYEEPTYKEGGRIERGEEEEKERKTKMDKPSSRFPSNYHPSNETMQNKKIANKYMNFLRMNFPNTTNIGEELHEEDDEEENDEEEEEGDRRFSVPSCCSSETEDNNTVLSPISSDTIRLLLLRNEDDGGGGTNHCTGNRGGSGRFVYTDEEIEMLGNPSPRLLEEFAATGSGGSGGAGRGGTNPASWGGLRNDIVRKEKNLYRLRQRGIRMSDLYGDNDNNLYDNVTNDNSRNNPFHLFGTSCMTNHPSTSRDSFDKSGFNFFQETFNSNTMMESQFNANDDLQYNHQHMAKSEGSNIEMGSRATTDSSHQNSNMSDHDFSKNPSSSSSSGSSASSSGSGNNSPVHDTIYYDVSAASSTLSTGGNNRCSPNDTNSVDNSVTSISPSNTTGGGSAYHSSFSIGKGVRYSTFSDTWVGDIMFRGKRLTQHFAVKKMGWEGAKAMALKWRQDMEMCAYHFR